MEEFLTFIVQHYLGLIPVGFVAGACGTLIGAGGGFILVPVLLLLYPNETPETITSISLAVVCCNALSGSLAYARARRIDYKAGVLCSIAAIPGAVLGALSTAFVSRQKFELAFGILMIATGGFLIVGSWKNRAAGTDDRGFKLGEIAAEKISRLSSSGLRNAIAASAVLGYLSSLSGVGAGFLYVPAFIYLLELPVHIATATSQFLLAVMAFTGTATHIAAGLFEHGVRRTVALALGVILGAQLGARLSGRVHGDWIIRGLAGALFLVGIRLLANVW